VIVDEYHGIRVLRDGLPENLARVDQRRVQDPARDEYVVLQTVLRVQRRDVELFDR